jgi:hypothetical protein
MMATAWILPAFILACGDVRQHSTTRECVDLMELNHFYDDAGRHVYDQVIFYEWAADAKAFHVRAWCLVDTKDPDHARPWRSQHDDRWHFQWFDKDHRLVRAIQSRQFRESWTQFDPERMNSKKLDQKLRTTLVSRQPKVAGDAPLVR